MNLKYKLRFLSHICPVLLFLLIAGSFIVSNSSMTYAVGPEDESPTQGAVIAQIPEASSRNADDEKMTEEMAKKIAELQVITIENKGYEKDRKGPAKFEHVKHAREYKISCWECHHEYKKDEQPTEEVKQTEQAEQSEETVQTEQPKEPLPKELTAQNIWSPWGITKKCAECHDPKEKKDDAIKLQAAYHKNCKTCHKDRRIYGDDTLAYRKCTTCHQ